MNSYILPDFKTPPPQTLPNLGSYAKEVRVGDRAFPVEYVRKEIGTVGRVVKDAAGRPFPLTKDLFDGVIKNFKRMRKNGVKVFIPTKHTHILSSDNRGYVEDVRLGEDGDFVATEQLIGEDAIRDASRNGQSMYLKWNATDDQGNTYPGYSLTHVAMVPDPQVSGMGGFESVAASASSIIDGVWLRLDDPAKDVAASVARFVGASPTAAMARLMGVALSAGPHKFSSVQADLPDEIASKVKAMAARIPDDDLAEDGRETDIHATCLYGLHCETPDSVREALASEGPIQIKLGKTSTFPAHGDHQYDVVKADVESADLHRINAKLSALPHTNKYPDYHPHVTLAYVKAGVGKQYEGMGDVSGESIKIPHVTFSARNGERHRIVLAGRPAAVAASILLGFDLAASVGDVALSHEYGPVDYWREIDGQAVPFTGSPGSGTIALPRWAAYVHEGDKGGNSKSTKVEAKGSNVTESNDKGDTNTTTHPTPAAAREHGANRVADLTREAKAKGTHIATQEHVAGPAPEGMASHTLKPVMGDKGEVAGHYLVGSKSGKIDEFVEGDRGKAEARVKELGGTAEPSPAPNPHHTGDINRDLESAAERVGQKVIADRVAKMNKLGVPATAQGEAAHKQRMKIADLRKELPGYSKAEQDAAILHHTMKGNLVPESIDDPRDITAEDREQAFATPSGEKREIAYWNKPFAGKTQEGAAGPPSTQTPAAPVHEAAAKLMGAAEKAPHEMTKAEWAGRFPTEAGRRLSENLSQHRSYIRNALSEGKSVPDSVLKEHPGVEQEAQAARANSEDYDRKTREESERRATAAAKLAAQGAASSAELETYRQEQIANRHNKTQAEYLGKSSPKGAPGKFLIGEHRQSITEAARAGKIDWNSEVGKQHARDYPEIASEYAEKPSPMLTPAEAVQHAKAHAEATRPPEVAKLMGMEEGASPGNHYVRNRETGKLELHFDKATYKAMEESMKSDIKRNFLFSPSRQAWVSRSSSNTRYAEEVAQKAGLKNAGETGEKVAFADKMQAAQERASDRADRFEGRADAARKEAHERFNSQNIQTVRGLQGEPIKVGHHSEGRHRRLLERADNDMRKGSEAYEKSQHYDQRAEASARTASASELSNTGFLARRIKEHEKTLRILQRNHDNATARMAEHPEKAEEYGKYKDRLNERAEEVHDKLSFYKQKLEDAGGVKFGKHNVNVGDRVMTRHGWAKVLRTNPQTVKVAFESPALRYATGAPMTSNQEWGRISGHEPADASPPPPAVAKLIGNESSRHSARAESGKFATRHIDSSRVLSNAPRTIREQQQATGAARRGGTIRQQEAGKGGTRSVLRNYKTLAQQHEEMKDVDPLDFGDALMSRPREVAMLLGA
jgi:2'-5' RNA ligase